MLMCVKSSAKLRCRTSRALCRGSVALCVSLAVGLAAIVICGFMIYKGAVADTKFEPSRGFYTNAISVTITSATVGAKIYYTTDSSVPTTNSALYSAPIPISKTTVLRAAAFKTGYFPSDINTHTYIFPMDVIHQPANPPGFPTSWFDGTKSIAPDYEMDQRIVTNAARGGTEIVAGLRAIPTLSIVTATSNMFGRSAGLYFGAGPVHCPASVEWINTNNTTGFQVNCGLMLHGDFSRKMSWTLKKSFKLKFRSEYGPSKLKFPMFDWDPAAADTFNEIVLRGGSDDSFAHGGAGASYVKDEFARRTQLAMGAPCSHGTFVHLYINGLYWGLYNVVEALGTDLAANYFGGDHPEWNAIVSGHAVDGSSLNAWTQMLNRCRAGLTDNVDYQRIQGNNPDGTRNPAYTNYLDLSNYIDYVILEHWIEINGDDWPGNNYGVANKLGSDSIGFKFFMWDAELSLSGQDMTDAHGGVADPFDHLRLNPEFRLLFADHVYRHCYHDGALTPARALARWLKLLDEVDPAIICEAARWGDMYDTSRLFDVNFWRGKQEYFYRYVQNLAQTAINRWRNAGLYPSIDAPDFNQHGGLFAKGFQLVMTAANAIYYTLDGSDPREYGTSSVVGMLYTGPITLTSDVTVKARARSPTNEWSALHEAVFTAEKSPLPRNTELLEQQP